MDLSPALPGLLLPWYEKNARDLPWRHTKEPYPVWLSEIMLQQTRVEAVKGYYARFLRELPDIRALADCDPDKLHKLWEGLGYYSRIRNLQAAAKVILERHGGVFPREHAAVRALPGIGDYTAGAVCSICFDLPTPAVDGNVLRVIARLTDCHDSTDRPSVKKQVTAALAAVYPREAGQFTQALMELGATVCGPNQPPRCPECPLAAICLGRARGTAPDLPVRDAKKPKRQQDRTVFLLECGGRYALTRRPESGLLAGLWQLPDAEGHLDTQAALELLTGWGLAPRQPLGQLERPHIFTHIRWNMRCHAVRCGAAPDRFAWLTPDQVAADAALPTAYRQFWDLRSTFGLE